MIRKPPPPRLIELIESDPADDWLQPLRAPATPEPPLPAEQGQEK